MKKLIIVMVILVSLMTTGCEIHDRTTYTTLSTTTTGADMKEVVKFMYELDETNPEAANELAKILVSRGIYFDRDTKEVWDQ